MWLRCVLCAVCARHAIRRVLKCMLLWRIWIVFVVAIFTIQSFFVLASCSRAIFRLGSAWYTLFERFILRSASESVRKWHLFISFVPFPRWMRAMLTAHSMNTHTCSVFMWSIWTCRVRDLYGFGSSFFCTISRRARFLTANARRRRCRRRLPATFYVWDCVCEIKLIHIEQERWIARDNENSDRVYGERARWLWQARVSSRWKKMLRFAFRIPVLARIVFSSSSCSCFIDGLCGASRHVCVCVRLSGAVCGHNINSIVPFVVDAINWDRNELPHPWCPFLIERRCTRPRSAQQNNDTPPVHPNLFVESHPVV